MVYLYLNARLSNLLCCFDLIIACLCMEGYGDDEVTYMEQCKIVSFWRYIHRIARLMTSTTHQYLFNVVNLKMIIFYLKFL